MPAGESPDFVLGDVVVVDDGDSDGRRDGVREFGRNGRRLGWSLSDIEVPVISALRGGL